MCNSKNPGYTLFGYPNGQNRKQNCLLVANLYERNVLVNSFSEKCYNSCEELGNNILLDLCVYFHGSNVWIDFQMEFNLDVYTCAFTKCTYIISSRRFFDNEKNFFKMQFKVEYI